MKKSAILALSLVAMLTACRGAPTITVEEAAELITAIEAAQDTEAVQNSYNDMKIVRTNAGEEITIIHSPANDYYRIEMEDSYIGAYEIDGVMTAVAISNGIYSSNTSATYVNSTILQIQSTVDSLVLSAFMVASILILAAQSLDSSSSIPSELEGLSVTLRSSGEGNLSAEARQGSNVTSVEINDNVPVRMISKATTSSESTDSDTTFTYGTSSGDRTIETAD